MTVAVSMKESIMKVINELPPERVAEVLDFALFLKERGQAKSQKFLKPEVKTAPIENLKALVGLVSLGGDALEDTERCYE
jgi:hypothetical protein